MPRETGGAGDLKVLASCAVGIEWTPSLVKRRGPIGRRIVYTVDNRAKTRTIYFRLQGLLREAEMEEWANEYKLATDGYGGSPHLVFADLRGMQPASPGVAAIMRQAIGYARSRGVICFARLSDPTVLRLEAARLAREVSPGDDITVDVVSVKEAERVLAEASTTLEASLVRRRAG